MQRTKWLCVALRVATSEAIESRNWEPTDTNCVARARPPPIGRRLARPPPAPTLGGGFCRRTSAASEKSSATKAEREARIVVGNSAKRASLFFERKPALW
eukprot:scaffold120594_cov22-Tisochrysis_lutea.AAC.2